MEEIYEMVRALREDRIPRNRHFELHRSATARKARRIHRFLRAVERDLRRSTDVRVTRRAEGGIRLELALASLQARRVIELDPHAHSLLLEDNTLARQLAAVQASTDD
jgi:hypothetical protein